MRPRPSLRRSLANLRKILRSSAGAFDLPSIIVGVVVVGILAAGVLAAVFGVIPFAQDNAARQDLDSVRTAEGVAKAKDAGYMDKAALVGAPYLSSSPHMAVGTDPLKACYLALAKSGTGKIFYSDNKMNEAKEFVAGVTLDCLTAPQVDTLITEIGGYEPSGTTPTAGSTGDSTSPAATGTYTPGGAVPAGYTYGADFGSCPAPFAEALKAKFVADGSQSYFEASYLYSIGKRDESDAAWDAYYVLDDAYYEKYSAMTPYQQATMDNFDGYASDVPGYDDLNNVFWDTPNQADFNLMNEKMASAVPAFCGAVTAGTGTLKCHPETQAYLAVENDFYHKYMYENERYSVDPTPENEAAWVAATQAHDPKFDGTGPVYQDQPKVDAAYSAMMSAVGSDYEVTMAENMHRAELDASLLTFQADTSVANFDIWVNYEYPLNACR